MVDPDTVAIDGQALKDLQDPAGAVRLVLEVRGVDQDKLVVLDSQGHLLLEDHRLVGS